MGIMKSVLIVCGILAVTMLALCIFLYNRRLDRIAKGEARGTHTSVPEPKILFFVVYMIFMFLMLYGTLIFSQRTNSHAQNYSGEIAELKSEIEDLRREIEESSTYFRRLSYVTRNPDFKEKKVDVFYTVELKEYSDDTKVTVNIDGTDVPLEKVMPGFYNGSFRTDMFKVIDTATVKITDDGRTVTEDRNDLTGEMFWDVIPNISTYYQNASTHISFGKLSFEGGYGVEIDDPENIDSVKVTYMTGDTEIKTLDITEDVLNGNRIVCDKITTEENEISFRYEVTTKDGLRIVDKRAVCFKNRPGNLEDEYEIVYDPDGNVLWDSRK